MDLDETLIYATEEKLEREPDFSVGQYFVCKRPFLDDFLDFCFENFEVAVWTTATKSYAEEILLIILRENQKLKFLWMRERCTFAFEEEERAHLYVKKMYKLRRCGQKIESVIVVVDSPNVWKCSYGNLIRVNKFEGDETDEEMQKLPLYLSKIKNAENIRAIEKRSWRNNL